MESKRRYPIFMVLNRRVFNEVVISSHYEENHDDMDDEIILEIVKSLNKDEKVFQERKDGWEYLEYDRHEYKGKSYRLILCIHDHQSMIGVINCFRR